LKQLRSYQKNAIKALWDYLFTTPGNPLIDAPVGAGKSLILSEFIRQVHETYPRTRILVLAHVKELLQQNAEELLEQYPDADFGFYCAGLGSKKLYNDITFASIQSIHDKLGNFNRAPEIIIVDEAHTIPHKSQTRYRNFFNQVENLNPNCKIIGFTGTPFRADTGYLDKGDSALFDAICYDIPIPYMIDQGYWAKPVTPKVDTKMDTSSVDTRAGDFVESQLQDAINTDDINKNCVSEMIQLAQNRQKWLIFTAGIEHCMAVIAELRNQGMSAEMITGDTPKDERNATIDRFKRGEFTALVNVAVLTTGFNVPDIDMLAFMRPTQSPVLYIQCMGRGVRPVYAVGYDLSTQQGRLDAIANSNKPDCMVLDFGGVIDRLGPIDQLQVKRQYTEKEKEDKQLPPTKVCPQCSAICQAAQRFCYECSYQFEFEAVEIQATAAKSAPVLSTDYELEWFKVVDVETKKHFNKRDETKPSTFRVQYYCETVTVNEFICFNHDVGTFPHKKAIQWHVRHRPDLDVPQSVDEALQNQYPRPFYIKCKPNGKYWDILDYDFDPPECEEKSINFDELEEIVDEWEIPF